MDRCSIYKGFKVRQKRVAFLKNGTKETNTSKAAHQLTDWDTLSQERLT